MSCPAGTRVVVLFQRHAYRRRPCRQYALATYMNPPRLQDNVIIDVRVNHCSHISGLLLEVFVFLAPMVICAHTPHHPYGL
jgi:hypothetical protein